MTSPARDELAEHAVAFLEVAVHAILHGRGVYPPTLFARRSAFGGIVHVARAPALCDAVGVLLSHLRGLLSRGVLDRVTIPLLRGPSGSSGGGAPRGVPGSPIEHYTFRVDVHARPVATTYADATTFFAAAITQLQATTAARSHTAPLPHDATWTVLIHAHVATPHLRLAEQEALVMGGETHAVDAPGVWARVDSSDPVVQTIEGGEGKERNFRVTAAEALPPLLTRTLKTLRASTLSIEVAVSE